MPVTQIEAFHRPRSLEQVWRLLDEGGPSTRLVGGGTDLTIACPSEVRILVDLAGLGLDRIQATPETVHVGAMATLTALLEHDALSRLAGGVLGEMLPEVGSPLLRNVATIGGHLARGHLSDIIPVLVALDAAVVVYDGREHRLSLEDYYRRRSNETPHILTALMIPTGATAAAFRRFSRTRYDYALVNVACRVDRQGPTVRTARVVVGMSSAPAARILAAEAGLVGTAMEDRVIAEAAEAVADLVEPESDRAASREYRRHLAEVLTRRCLATARGRAGW